MLPISFRAISLRLSHGNYTVIAMEVTQLLQISVNVNPLWTDYKTNTVCIFYGTNSRSHHYFPFFLLHTLWPQSLCVVWYPWWQGSWGQHGAHLGPTGPRWAPCWPHEPCYLGWANLNDCHNTSKTMGFDVFDTWSNTVHNHLQIKPSHIMYLPLVTYLIIW